ncbi:Leucine-rich repeat-containing protein 49 [Papilio machaon]|uniref:Leucine-rich repeat-containing protein 49 n=1 Tax=Papilio machaon TaxID=76193 RepID=A0A194QVP7_PAPMA|nr:Leucine-rich repeat-containing protein 49 [Papilio machaon]
MHVTDQVRAAAMAWRNNKEAAHAAYCALGGSAQQAARRDQIIHNARTNWELLRSENKCFNAVASLEKNIEKEFVLEQSSITITQNDSTQTMDATLAETAFNLHQETEDSDCKNNISDASIRNVKDGNVKKTQVRKFQRSSTARKVSEKRVNFSDRSVSQDTDVSHSTSTSSDVKFPPILLPIISSLENVKLSDGTESILKRWDSVDPIIDSSFSSFPSSSSDSEDETKKKPLKRMPTVLRNRQNFSSSRSKSVCDPESRKVKAKNQDQVENTSNISCSTNTGSVNTSSTSGSDQNQRTLRRDSSLNSRMSNRNVRSATISRRSERASSGHRASTARAKSGKSLASLKSSEPVPKSMPPSKDREQGVDYLVEVSEGTVSAWGAGAVRRLARDWDWERARAVTRAAFHYVHFNAVAQSLSELKTRFPNITHISVRATGLQYLGQLHALAELRGITGLTIMPEGNPICSKYWREYSIYRLAHWGLKEINDEKVTDEELKSANRTYQGLSDIVLRAIPDAPLQPLLSRLGRNSNSTSSAKAWLRAADPALRDVIAKEALQFKKGQVSQEDMSWRVRGRGQLSHAIEVACGAAQRLRTLELQWPTIFVEMIEDILHDFIDMDNHVKEQMRTLSDS